MSDDIVEVLRRAARFIEEHYTGVFTDDLRADAKALRDLALALDESRYDYGFDEMEKCCMARNLVQEAIVFSWLVKIQTAPTEPE